VFVRASGSEDQQLRTCCVWGNFSVSDLIGLRESELARSLSDLSAIDRIYFNGNELHGSDRYIIVTVSRRAIFYYPARVRVYCIAIVSSFGPSARSLVAGRWVGGLTICRCQSRTKKPSQIVLLCLPVFIKFLLFSSVSSGRELFVTHTGVKRMRLFYYRFYSLTLIVLLLLGGRAVFRFLVFILCPCLRSVWLISNFLLCFVARACAAMNAFGEFEQLSQPNHQVKISRSIQ